MLEIYKQKVVEKPKTKSPELRQIALKLFEYLQTHTIDADNSLIGIQANNAIQNDINLNENAPLVEGQSKMSVEWLMEKILKWEELDDMSIARQVRSFAAIIKSKLVNFKTFELILHLKKDGETLSSFIYPLFFQTSFSFFFLEGRK